MESFNLSRRTLLKGLAGLGAASTFGIGFAGQQRIALADDAEPVEQEPAHGQPLEATVDQALARLRLTRT